MSMNGPTIFDAEATVTESVPAPNPPRLELIIDKEVPGILAWRFDELNAALDYELAKYKNKEITKENVMDAKRVRADLNNLSKAINDKKIQVKKTFCAPYDDFAAKVKTLLVKIKDVTTPIDEGIKSLEDQEKQAKRQLIIEHMAEYMDEKFDEPFIKAMSLDLVWDEKWLNKSCALSKANKELESAIDSCWNTYQSISTLCGPDVTKCQKLQEIFLTSGNFDLSKSMDIYARTIVINAAKSSKSVEPTPTNPTDTPSDIPQAPAMDIPMPQPVQQEATVDPNPTVSEPVYHEVTFTVKGTAEQLNALVSFMNTNHILFRQIRNQGGNN